MPQYFLLFFINNKSLSIKQKKYLNKKIYILTCVADEKKQVYQSDSCTTLVQHIFILFKHYIIQNKDFILYKIVLNNRDYKLILIIKTCGANCKIKYISVIYFL